MSYKQRGFTLIEMMITLIVMAIVIAIAVPNFTELVRNNASTSLAGQLQVALNFARTEAVKRSARVSICPSLDGLTCATATDWAKGWMVFADTATSDSSATVTVGTVLQYWGQLDTNAAVTAKKGSTNISFVRFNSSGMLASSGATDTSPRVFTVQVNNCTSDHARTLSIGIAGLLTASKSNCQ